MGYTHVALEDMILEMYPEITEHRISLRVSFDEERDVWLVKLKKDNKEYEVCLEKEDAERLYRN